MSKADVYIVTTKREALKNEFQALVPVKKTPEVFAQRQALKARITRLSRWLKELETAKPCT
jgi:hypothetical protein